MQRGFGVVGIFAYRSLLEELMKATVVVDHGNRGEPPVVTSELVGARTWSLLLELAP